jgi:hypothetical protein
MITCKIHRQKHSNKHALLFAMDSPRTPRTSAGGSRSGSGRKKATEFRILSHCYLRTASGTRCTNVVNKPEFGCHLHRDKHIEEHPVLNRVMTDVKRQFSPFPMKGEDMNEELENDLNAIWEACYHISSMSSAFGMTKHAVLEKYQIMFEKIRKLDIKLTKEDEVFFTMNMSALALLTATQNVAQIAQARENEALQRQQEEMLRRAEIEMKKANDMKLKNDVAELCGTVEEMAIDQTPPNSQPTDDFVIKSRTVTDESE